MTAHEGENCHPALRHTKLHIGHSFVWTHIFPESSQVPKTRAKHATCLHQGAIYLYGGICGNSALKDMWRYEPGTSLWARLECRGEAPPVLQEHTMVGYKESIYIFGGLCGFDNPGEISLWMLDLETFTWSKQVIDSEVTTPASRRGHSVVIHQGGMHLFGGHVDLKGSSNELWTLDFETLYWHLSVIGNQDPIPPPRHGHSAVLSNNSMYIYGGSNNLQELRDLWRWDFGCRQWSKVRFWQGPPALSGHSAISLGDSMLVYGGQDSGGSFKNDLWVFSYSSESWTKAPFKGSIIPSPTTQQTLEMNIPDSSSTLFPSSVQDERSLSAPFLQRPSLSSLRIKALARPHSSPPYTIDTSTGAKMSRKDRAFRNRVHPTRAHHRHKAASSNVIGDGSHTNSQTRTPDSDSDVDYHGNPQFMFDNSDYDDDDDDDCDDVDGSGEEDDTENDPYKSRIFIPVGEHLLNSSQERLLQSSEQLREPEADICTSAKTILRRSVMRPGERTKMTRTDSPARTNLPERSSCLDCGVQNHVPSGKIEHLKQREHFGKSRNLMKQDKVNGSLPEVRIEDFDGVAKQQENFHNNGGSLPSVDVCNNYKKFSNPPALVQVLPRCKSDELSLLPLNGSVASIDDLYQNEASNLHGRYVFENAGFTMMDDNHNSLSTTSSRPRSNSLTSLVHKLNEKNSISAEERHQSLNDLPNMASLILQRHDHPKKNRTQLYDKHTPSRGTKRPKLKKRSQTDQALYAKTKQYNNEGYSSSEEQNGEGGGGGGKGRIHLPFPVHLYVLGGQEPNVGSLHKYQTPMPVLRCTIVPGKPSPGEIQALLI